MAQGSSKGGLLEPVKSAAGATKTWLPLVVSFASLFGAVLGAIAFFELRDFDVRATGFVNPNEATAAGYAARVTLINSGSKPETVNRASLTIGDGSTPLRIFDYVSDGRVLEQAATNPEEVLRQRQQLPVLVDARSALTVGLFLDLGVLNTGKEHDKAEKAEFCRIIRGQKRELTLHLHFVSGETRDVDLNIAGLKRSGFPWSATVKSERDDPLGISFARKGAAPTDFRLVEMKVWDADSPGRHFTLERPVLGAQPSYYPLPKLAEGSYDVTFAEDDELILANRLVVPTPTGARDLARQLQPTGICEKYARKALAAAP
jgi:hypothetical protein